MDKFFQIFSLAVMTFGILGLPLFFWLGSRKKRLLAEYEEQQKTNPDEPIDKKEDWRI